MEQNIINVLKSGANFIKAVVLILLITICVCICLRFFAPHSKVVGVNMKKVFEEFNYTKELKLKRDDVLGARKKILDSLELEARLISKEVETNKDPKLLNFFKVKMEYFANQKRTYEEDNTALTNDYDAKILLQLSQYIKEFGEMNKYEVIIGSGETETIVYSKPANDITYDVIIYINKKYKGY